MCLGGFFSRKLFVLVVSQQDAAEQLSPLDMVFYATMEVGHMIWSLEGKPTCNIFPARRSR